jgi:hypothetical protein
MGAPWWAWLIVAATWLGWAVYQIATGPVWWALTINVIACCGYVWFAARTKIKQDRRRTLST